MRINAEGFTGVEDYHPFARTRTRALDSIAALDARCAAMRCAACNAGVTIATGERVGFRDTCERCDADLHVCLNCAHHDPSAYNECREPNTEGIADRERANRCDWFSPTDAQGGGRDSSGAEQRNALDALFKK